MIDIVYGSDFTLDWTECKHIIEGRSIITFQPSLAHSIFDSQRSLTGEMIDCHFLRLEALYAGRKGPTTGKEWLWGGRKSGAKASSGSSSSTLKARSKHLSLFEGEAFVMRGLPQLPRCRIDETLPR